MSADPASRRAGVVDASSRDLRCTLGPTAWLVFEELLLCSTEDGDGCVAVVSVRSLAGSLGLAKDTVARAVGRIRDAGLVSVEQQRADTGMYSVGTYRIITPDSIRPVVSSQPASPASLKSVAAPRVLRRRAPAHQAMVAQLALVFEA